jgi:hypothetical protein
VGYRRRILPALIGERRLLLGVPALPALESWQAAAALELAPNSAEAFGSPCSMDWPIVVRSPALA